MLDDQSRCAHFHTHLDIIAIKFKCCGEFYACFDCHEELAGHTAAVWPRSEWNEKAILCGHCGCVMTIDEYLTCGDVCPSCSSHFNPRCRNHHHLYFEQVPA